MRSINWPQAPSERGSDMHEFKDKVVLVTGGSRGLGRAMVRGFAERGARVIIASRKLEACETLAAEIESSDGEALAGAVTRLLRDRELASDLAARGPQRASRFRWQDAAERLEAIFLDVL